MSLPEDLSCKVNSTENLRLINGTLAITGIYQKMETKIFTSAALTSIEHFKYGRFELRAALPQGKLLAPLISLVPAIRSSVRLSQRDGEVAIVDYFQELITNRIHFVGKQQNVVLSGTVETEASLSQFHTYSFTWNETDMTWLFDDQQNFHVNLTKTFDNLYKPFDDPFKLVLNLIIGGRNFDLNNWTLQDIINWNCSLLIIDYVRVYQFSEHSNETDVFPLNISDSQVSIADICGAVMPFIIPLTPKNDRYFWIICSIISILILFLILIIILIYLIPF